jgi:hypothetical protein
LIYESNITNGGGGHFTKEVRPVERIDEGGNFIDGIDVRLKNINMVSETL